MRKLIAAHAAALFAGIVVPVAATAQSYPSKPIRMIVGLAAGGSTDITARLMAEKIRPLIGQPVVVENRPGAGTYVAAQAVSQSAPDGYTLLFAGGTLATGPHLMKAWTLDGTKDFTPISQLVKGVTILTAQPKSPYNTLDEWIAYMKANPGKLNYANISLTDLIGFEMIKNTTGVRFETIRFGGATPAQNAFLGGQADFYAVPVGSIAKSLLESGKVKFLTIMSAERSPIMPQIPSFADSASPELRELGRNSLLGSYWFGMFGPGGLPRPIVTTIYEAVQKVNADPDWQKRMADLGLVTVASAPDVFAELIRTENARFAVEAKKAGVTPQ